MIFKKEYKSVYFVVFVLTFLFLLLYSVDFLLHLDLYLSSMEHKWYDFKFTQLVSLGKLKDADKRIIIVGIDDKTLKKYGWPMPRKYYKNIIENLNKYGAKVIGFDVLFMDPDRTSPENDEIFAQTVRKNKNVVIGFSLDERGEIVRPNKTLLESTTNFGSLSAAMMLDPDGKIRKIYPFTTFGSFMESEKKYSLKELSPSCPDVGVPLLGAYLYSYYSGESLESLYKKWNTELGDKSFIINFRKPLDDSISAMYYHISAKDLIENKISDKTKLMLNGSIVLVGSLAQGAFDHYPTPVREHTPGVEIHAVCADNLLNDDYLISVKWYIVAFLIILYTWLPAFLIKNSVVRISVYNFVALALIMLTSIWLVKYRYDFYFTTYFIPNIASYIYVIAYKSIVEDRQKRWIKNTFSQYLSPEVVNIIVKDPSKLKLGGEKRDISVFFMDIAGFTSMSEKLTPEEVTNLLNEYLSELSDVILENNGVIDKYIGDCIMAFWNAPLDLKNHRTHAVKAAMSSIERIKLLNERNKNTSSVSVRIGINSGEVIVGNMGSNKRFSYTVLGDNVNLASRLEGANKYFHTRIMVSDDVYKEAKESIAFKYIGEILVVGKTQAVKVWEPYKPKEMMDEKDKEFMKFFENGIKYFYDREYSKSKEIFEKAENLLKGDSLTLFYINFIEDIMKNAKDFDGIFNIRSK